MQENLDISNRIKLLTAQSVNCSYRILDYCDETEKLGIHTTNDLNNQYETIKKIHNQLAQMDKSLIMVEKNLKKLKKSKIRWLFEELFCCCFYSKSEIIYDSECSLKSSASLHQPNNSVCHSDVYIAIKDKKTSLRSLSVKSLKSAFGSVCTGSLKLVRSSASLLRSKGQHNKTDSISELEKCLDSNIKNIDLELNNLQVISVEISRKIDIKHGYLSQLNQHADVNIQRVKSVDSMGRRLYTNRKKN